MAVMRSVAEAEEELHNAAGLSMIAGLGDIWPVGLLFKIC